MVKSEQLASRTPLYLQVYTTSHSKSPSDYKHKAVVLQQLHLDVVQKCNLLRISQTTWLNPEVIIRKIQQFHQTVCYPQILEKWPSKVVMVLLDSVMDKSKSGDC
ncbi:hypothetical protein chiPu_0006083 [Chiloscyllium punctatum]|uniref:Uncharacterized protein n=1 Tax=Chiloscyllium punctatum TaxID=137246 RepID=A0A401SB82_CHIPU|nr:hypothetical protein [Chiloscyllium punctatum]